MENLLIFTHKPSVDQWRGRCWQVWCLSTINWNYSNSPGFKDWESKAG